MSLSWPSRKQLRGCLPPSRCWWITEIAILIIGSSCALARIGFVGSASAAAPPPRPRVHAVVDMPTDARSRLMTAFPAMPIDPQTQRDLFARFTEKVAELELSLDSREMDPNLLSNFPPRRRMKIAVRGEPGSQIRLLQYLVELPAAVRIVGFEWSSGGGPGDRLIEITAEFFVNPGKVSEEEDG